MIDNNNEEIFYTTQKFAFKGSRHDLSKTFSFYFYFL